jgi:hypothetical protein
MRIVLAAGAAVAVALVAASAALPVAPPIARQPISKLGSPPADPVTVSLSSVKAGARRVRLTLRMPSVLQCGYPRGGAVSIVAPPAARVPARIVRGAVRVNGKRAGAVAVHARTVTVAMPRPAGVICDSLVDGTMLVRIAPSAGLGNPHAAGTYRFRIHRGGAIYAARVRITR